MLNIIAGDMTQYFSSLNTLSAGTLFMSPSLGMGHISQYLCKFEDASL